MAISMSWPGAASGGNRPRIPSRGFVTLSTAAALLFLAAIHPTAEGKEG